MTQDSWYPTGVSFDVIKKIENDSNEVKIGLESDELSYL